MLFGQSLDDIVFERTEGINIWKTLEIDFGKLCYEH